MWYNTIMNWNNREQVREYHRAYRAKKRIPRLIEAENKRQLLYKSLWNLPPTELAYIAGFFDGEGCISIVKGHSRRIPIGKKWSPEYGLHFSLSNQHIPTLTYIKTITGLGGIYRDSPDRKNNYKWAVSSNQAMEILKILLPYLKIKLPQAQLAIKFQSILAIHNRGGLKRNKLTEAQLQERAELKRELMRLNHSYSIQP